VGADDDGTHTAERCDNLAEGAGAVVRGVRGAADADAADAADAAAAAAADAAAAAAAADTHLC
jgi:hypothetical protein